MTEDKEHEAIWQEISAIRNDISKVSGNILQMTKVLSDFLSRHDAEHVELSETLRSIAYALEAVNGRVERLSMDQDPDRENSPPTQ